MTTKQPQDRLPKKTAAQREAEGDETTTITWRDKKFTIPSQPDDLDWEAGKALESQHLVGFVESVLGPKQFDELTKMKPRPKLGDMGELGKQIATHYGFVEQGE